MEPGFYGSIAIRRARIALFQKEAVGLPTPGLEQPRSLAASLKNASRDSDHASCLADATTSRSAPLGIMGDGRLDDGDHVRGFSRANDFAGRDGECNGSRWNED